MIWAILSEIVLSGTTISLQPSALPDIIAEVRMDNVMMNGAHDEIDAALSIPGLTIGVTFDWESGDYGEDSVIVTPPDGVLCKPASCVLELQEGQAGSLWLYEFVGF